MEPARSAQVMSPWFAFLLGVWIGGIVGVVVLGVFQVGGRADD
jgi:type II secretory pathway component PulF